ncbi:MAG: 16S rRNA (uracil(1498)-N(3))-methyltransferase [Candidatus Omnitrophica bacterium]|nr:16S rRNA (uracil(1498)-N(3))-methyltransferase [Candidatus Omnitrophota bacterium]MDD5436021.1 16S rRNA (uracil(1498)-N(3))-methyltransferase [Candidatus Omnitrophota bacterium]
MSRFFVPSEAVSGNSIIVTGKEAHHILDVMRLKMFDTVVTFDGTGKEYVGVINDISRNSLTIGITEIRTSSEKEISSITLLQALPKKEKMDYIVQKSTELGVHSIVPVLTERTIPVWDEAKMRAQAARWKKIATEAAKQCGRVDIPEISPISKFTDAIKDFPGFDMRLIAVLSDEAVPLKNAIGGLVSGKVVLAIGPEGDFTADETAAAKKYSFKPISLGRRVLKSDTAGLALLSILNYELSN